MVSDLLTPAFTRAVVFGGAPTFLAACRWDVLVALHRGSSSECGHINTDDKT